MYPLGKGGHPYKTRSVLVKAKDNMAHYYNQRQTPAPSFAPDDKVYLDSEDIQTTKPSKKTLALSIRPLSNREMRQQVCLLANPPALDETSTFCVQYGKTDPSTQWPIPGRSQTLPPPPELVEGEEEYIVEEVLNSRLFRQKIQYLVKWEAMGSNTTLGNIQTTSITPQTRWPSSTWDILAHLDKSRHNPLVPSLSVHSPFHSHWVDAFLRGGWL